MKTIKKEDLIENEIYKASTRGLTFVMKATENLNNVINIPSYNKFMKNGNFNSSYLTFTNSTPEEKHWLNVCIEADKFISYDEAMKTFIPEYVECIEKAPHNYYGEVGKVYKVANWNYTFNNCLLIGTTSGSTDRKRFKPSTKEAYDAQFVVKEPEFVLPENWCIQVTSESKPYIKKYRQSINYTPYDIRNYDYQTQKCGTDYIYGLELTLEQFKKYVLKEKTAIEFSNKIDKEIIGPLPQFKVIETIETITKVENNEGSQFFIGDKIKTTANNIVRTISSFSYNQDKTKLYANFKETLDVVNINLIEHYIIPKIDFVLPKKWCIKSKNRKHDKILNSYARSIGATWWDDISNYISKLYMLVDNSQYFNSSELKPTTHTEITFEQFEKYVLNKTVEVKKETLLEKAKRLYPAGTNIISLLGRSGIIKTDIIYQNLNCDNTASIYADSGAYNIYCEKQNKWAEIVK